MWTTGHPWRASKHFDLQLSLWSHSLIFLCFLFHPLLSFATFSSVYLFFYIPEHPNLMRFSLLLLLLCIMCVQSNSIFFFIWIFTGFCLVILHNSSFVILSVHFTFIIRLKHLFINICNIFLIWLVVFQVWQLYNNTDCTVVRNILILTLLYMLWFIHDRLCGLWSEFLATDTEVSGSIPSATRFSE